MVQYFLESTVVVFPPSVFPPSLVPFFSAASPIVQPNEVHSQTDLPFIHPTPVSYNG